MSNSLPPLHEIAPGADQFPWLESFLLARDVRVVDVFEGQQLLGSAAGPGENFAAVLRVVPSYSDLATRQLFYNAIGWGQITPLTSGQQG